MCECRADPYHRGLMVGKLFNKNYYNVRLSKLIAVCMGISRKDAERHIKDGNVTLYGKVVPSSAMMISYSEITQPNNVAALMIQK